MKHITRITILTLAISGLSAGRNVLAEPADAAALVKPKPASEEPKKCDRWEGREKRLEALKTDLKLNANQEAAWTEWVGKIKAIANLSPQRSASMPDIPTVDEATGVP